MKGNRNFAARRNWRSDAATKSRFNVTAFHKLTLTLSALTFLGVWGLITPAKVTASGGEAFYANCDAARSAGAAPLHAGEPGYRPKLDRDGDGVACEPYVGF